MKRASSTAPGSEYPSIASHLYDSVLKHLAAYLMADTVSKLPRGPSVHAEAEKMKERNLRGIQNISEQIKRHALALSVEIPGFNIEYFSGFQGPDDLHNQRILDLTGVYKDIRCPVSYDVFLYSILQDIQGESLEVFRTHYDSMVAKQKIVTYLARYARSCSLSVATRIPTHVTPESANKQYQNEIVAEVLQKMYCTWCKRAITMKMIARHNKAKSHAKKEAVYMCLTPAACFGLLQRYAVYIRIFQSEIKKAYNEVKKAKTLILSLVPRSKIKPELKKIKNTKGKSKTRSTDRQSYTCEVCDTQIEGEMQFMRHFQKRKHRSELKKMGVVDPDDFSGITTKKGVQARLHILSQ